MSSFYSLIERSKECMDLYDKTGDSEYLMEIDCIDHFFECEGLNKYSLVAKFCKERGFNKAYDIGCAYGHQSEVFLLNGINYFGIDENCTNFWNKDKCEYKTKSYPFKINAKENELAVSILCLTWNCYLDEGDITLHNQLKQLSDDFNNCLLYIAKDKVNIVKKYFKGYEHIEGNFHYFYK